MTVCRECKQMLFHTANQAYRRQLVNNGLVTLFRRNYRGLSPVVRARLQRLDNLSVSCAPHDPIRDQLLTDLGLASWKILRHCLTEPFRWSPHCRVNRNSLYLTLPLQRYPGRLIGWLLADSQSMYRITFDGRTAGGVYVHYGADKPMLFTKLPELALYWLEHPLTEHPLVWIPRVIREVQLPPRWGYPRERLFPRPRNELVAAGGWF